MAYWHTSATCINQGTLGTEFSSHFTRTSQTALLTKMRNIKLKGNGIIFFPGCLTGSPNQNSYKINHNISSSTGHQTLLSDWIA